MLLAELDEIKSIYFKLKLHLCICLNVLQNVLDIDLRMQESVQKNSEAIPHDNTGNKTSQKNSRITLSHPFIILW